MNMKSDLSVRQLRQQEGGGAFSANFGFSQGVCQREFISELLPDIFLIDFSTSLSRKAGWSLIDERSVYQVDILKGQNMTLFTAISLIRGLIHSKKLHGGITIKIL